MKTRTKPTLSQSGQEPAPHHPETQKQREKRQTSYDRVISLPKGFLPLNNFQDVTVSDNQTYAAPNHKISDEKDVPASSIQNYKQNYDTQC